MNRLPQEIESKIKAGGIDIEYPSRHIRFEDKRANVKFKILYQGSLAKLYAEIFGRLVVYNSSELYACGFNFTRNNRRSVEYILRCFEEYIDRKTGWYEDFGNSYGLEEE